MYVPAALAPDGDDDDDVAGGDDEGGGHEQGEGDQGHVQLPLPTGVEVDPTLGAERDRKQLFLY